MHRHGCPHCKKTGLVRAERVIKAGEAFTEFTCNACDHTWRESDKRPDARPPKRRTKR